MTKQFVEDNDGDFAKGTDGGTVRATSVATFDSKMVDEEEFDTLFGDESEEWPEHTTSKGFHAPWFVTVFTALLLIVGGLWLGAYLERGHSSSTSTSSFASLFTSGSATGLSGFSRAASNATTGTVTDIVGDTLYVTTSSGSLVAVKISSSTTLDRNASTTLAGLKPGDTVTVQGSKNSSGSIQATSVSDTAKGVTSSGFGPG